MCLGETKINFGWIFKSYPTCCTIFVILLACKTPEGSDDKGRPGVRSHLQDIPRYQQGRKVLALGIIFLQYL